MKKSIEMPGILLPEIDDATRREFLIGAAGILLLAPYGCGNGGDETESSGETRTVRHVSGTTEVPVRPTRVASFLSEAATNLLLLGVTPLTGPDNVVEFVAPFRNLLPDSVDLDAIELVGAVDEPNLELIAAADPQMILAYSWVEAMYEDLSPIAPTVMVEWASDGEWRAIFERTATVVGRAEEAAEIEAEYEESLTSLGDSADMSVSFIRMSSGGTFTIDGPGSFPGSVMSDAGVSVAEAPEGVGEDGGFGYVENISGERLTEVAGDVIVVPDNTGLGYSDEPDLAAFERNPLWERLPAVQAGRVVSLPGSVYNGGNYAAARRLIEAIADTIG